jgi:hypothetical protein
MISLTNPTNNETFAQGENVTFVAEITDNEDAADQLTVEWSSSLDGIFSTTGPNSSNIAQFTTSSLTAGTHAITVTATDTTGLYTDALLNINIDGIPTQPTVTISPNPATTGDDLTATATGSTDADGGNITYSYEWVYGSNTVNGSTLSSSETTKGQEWTVTATPNDGMADGPSVSQTVTIGNTAPENLVVTITPNTAVYNDSELTCSATANDVDTADTLQYTYEWSIVLLVQQQ